jgi:hypothetical protein
MLTYSQGQNRRTEHQKLSRTLHRLLDDADAIADQVLKVAERPHLAYQVSVPPVIVGTLMQNEELPKRTDQHFQPQFIHRGDAPSHLKSLVHETEQVLDILQRNPSCQQISCGPKQKTQLQFTGTQNNAPDSRFHPNPHQQQHFHTNKSGVYRSVSSSRQQLGKKELHGKPSRYIQQKLFSEKNGIRNLTLFVSIAKKIELPLQTQRFTSLLHLPSLSDPLSLIANLSFLNNARNKAR